VAFRRMRSKCNGTDFTKASWEAGFVGIWYGGWTASDFDRLKVRFDGEALNTELSKRNRKARLTWDVSRGMMSTVWKFWDMDSSTDWVFTQFDGCIHIAKLRGQDVLDAPQFDHNREIYKARRIHNKKKFEIARLPDCFRLLASAGQGNCHEVKGTRPLVSLLAECRDVEDLLHKWNAKPLSERLELLGPKSWESVALAYLILEEGFLPAGLSVGRTLPVFDHVGARQDGTQIFAQCKGDRVKVRIEPEFLEQVRQIPRNLRRAYYFAYAGVHDDAGDIQDVKVVTNADFLRWLSRTANGKMYAKLLA